MRRLAVWSFRLLSLAVLVLAAILYDRSEGRFVVPPAWDPRAPLDLDAAPNPVWRWRVSRVLDDARQCRAILSDHAVIDLLPDFVASDDCGIAGRVRVSRLSHARLEPVETTCAIAMRLYLWERQILRPAAVDLLGADIAAIRHFGSYSCRTIAGSRRMSRHARAEAIDIAGFDLADGRRLSLRRDWDDGGAKGAFLRRARDGACARFSGVLSPDYNAAHADHFHIKTGGWRFCR